MVHVQTKFEVITKPHFESCIFCPFFWSRNFRPSLYSAVDMRTLSLSLHAGVDWRALFCSLYAGVESRSLFVSLYAGVDSRFLFFSLYAGIDSRFFFFSLITLSCALCCCHSYQSLSLCCFLLPRCLLRYLLVCCFLGCCFLFCCIHDGIPASVSRGPFAASYLPLASFPLALLLDGLYPWLVCLGLDCNQNLPKQCKHSRVGCTLLCYGLPLSPVRHRPSIQRQVLAWSR